MVERKKTSVDVLQEEKMSDCSCGNLKVTIYCDKPVKCNNQTYYCLECSDFHDHKPIIISRATALISKQWSEEFEKISELYEKANQRYDKNQELLNYCEEAYS